MGYYEARVDFSGLNLFEEWFRISLDVGLPHLQGEALVHSGTKRDFIGHPHIDSRDGDCASLTAAQYCLANDMHPIGGEVRRCLHVVQIASPAP